MSPSSAPSTSDPNDLVCCLSAAMHFKCTACLVAEKRASNRQLLLHYLIDA